MAVVVVPWFEPSAPPLSAVPARARRSRAPRRLLFAAVAVPGFVWGAFTCGPALEAAFVAFAGVAAFVDGARAVWIQCSMRLAPLLARP